ncbi:Glutamate-rich WD repeat-containing protein 1, partial [Lonchura striata]
MGQDSDPETPQELHWELPPQVSGMLPQAREQFQAMAEGLQLHVVSVEDPLGPSGTPENPQELLPLALELALVRECCTTLMYKPILMCLFLKGSPCLSFDVVRDGLGDGREEPPLSVLLCAGTQAETPSANRVLLLQMQNLHGLRGRRGSDSDSDSDSEEEEEEEEGREPQLLLLMAPHYGGINRL